MTLEDSIYEELLSTTAITAEVGARIYRGWRTQESKIPCITILKISMTPVNCSAGPAGTESARFQLDTWAKSAKAAARIAKAVKDTLAGWSSTSPVSSSFRLDSEQELPVEPDGAAGQWEYRVTQDFLVWYTP